MKKIYIALLVPFFITPNISLASIDINLKYGSRGGEVTELQEFFIDKGFLTGQPSGNFFALTRKAVIAWQTSVGLPTTGYVGPMTRTKINAELEHDNALSVSTETVEPSTISTQPTTATSLGVGCASTKGFSVISGKPCSTNVVTTNTTANKIVTFPNGAIAEVDSKGEIVRWAKESSAVPQVTIQSSEATTALESVLSVTSGAPQPINGFAIGGVARVPFTKVTLTAGASDVIVNGVTIQRTGLAVDANFSGVVILNDTDGAQLDIPKTLDSKHQAIVGGTFTVKAGTSKTVTVAGNMATAGTPSRAGQVATLSVVAINTTATVTGTLPIVGASHMISDAFTPQTPVAIPAPVVAPPVIISTNAITYSDYNFKYQWGDWAGLNEISCPMTPRNLGIKKAVFQISAVELQKISELVGVEPDGFKVTINSSAASIESRRADKSRSGVYVLEEKSPNTFTYFGGEISICSDGSSVTIGDISGTLADTTAQGRNVKAYLAQKGIAVDVWDNIYTPAADVSFKVYISPVMSEWEVWDYTTNTPVKINPQEAF